MTAKEYLSQIKKADWRIEQKRQEIKRLTEQATSTTKEIKASIRSQGVKDKLGDIVVKLADLKKIYTAELNNLVELKEKIIREIEQLEDSRYSLLLYLRYVSHKDWGEIAKEMNYSERGIYKLHGHALLKFSEVCSKVQ